MGPFIKIYAFWNHFWQIDFWRTNPHILIGSNDRAAKERCRWPSKDGLWWDLNLIPKFTKIFENSRNFQVIVVFIKNNAFRRNLSPWTLSRAGKSHWTSPNLRLGQTPFKMINLKKFWDQNFYYRDQSSWEHISTQFHDKKKLKALVFFAS